MRFCSRISGGRIMKKNRLYCFVLILFLINACGKSDSLQQNLNSSAPNPSTPHTEVDPIIRSTTSIFSNMANSNEIEVITPFFIGAFRNTIYYLKEESSFQNRPKDTEVKDLSGRVIARVNSRFKQLMDIEGSGKLMDGRVLNYAGRVRGEIRYQFTKHNWGLGVGDCGLIPFRSLAVDQDLIPYGSIVRIQETVGMPLPDGSRHDGYWIASDTGGAIRGDRIDLFTGKESWRDFIDHYQIDHLQALHINLIAKATLQSCVHQQPN